MQRNHMQSAYAELAAPGQFPENMPFSRQILLGNDHRALAFFMESDEFFRPEHNPAALQLERKDGRCTVRVNLIAQPAPLTGNFRYSFGWQAAPLKPLPAGWRGWIQNYKGKFAPQTRLIQIWSWSRWYGFLRPISEQQFSRQLDDLKQHYPEAALQPYFCQYILSMLSPEYRLYGKEWEKAPRTEIMEFGPKYPGKSVVACLGPGSYREFWLDSLREFLEKHPQINGCYWDSIDPVVCESRLHGHGWIDSKGKLNPTNDILHYRDFYMRAYKIIKSKHPDAVITGHTSARRNLPTMAFCDVLYDGEQFVSSVSANPDYCDTLDDNYCRSFFGTQYGVVPMLLPAYYNNADEVSRSLHPTETVYLHALVYGFLVHSHRINDQVTDSLLKITRDFGIADAEFSAPWDRRGAALLSVRSGSADNSIRTGIYQRNGALLAAIGNFGREPAPVEVKPMFPFETAAERRSGKMLSANPDGNILLTVPAHNFILLEIKGK